jgi:hypothetical protein
MAILVVGGSSRNVGKTSLVCGLIAAVPLKRWIAVKITSHAHGHALPIWEETDAGQRTDTARFLAAGARRALLVTVFEGALPVNEIKAALEPEANVIFESNSIVGYVQPDLCIGVIGGLEADRKLSFEPFLRRADAVVALEDAETSAFHLPAKTRLFQLADFNILSVEMVDWLGERLNAPRRS